MPAFGSSFPVRYVSPGLLFLQPLGTFYRMRSKALSVNIKVAVFGSFSAYFFAF